MSENGVSDSAAAVLLSERLYEAEIVGFYEPQCAAARDDL